MKNKAIELKNEVNELMDLCIKYAGRETIEAMDDATFSMLRKCLKIMNLAEDMMVEQAEILEDMNTKLDELLYRMKIIGDSK